MDTNDQEPWVSGTARAWCRVEPRRSLLSELGDLLFPRACAGCGRPDTVLCAECEVALRSPPLEVSARAPRLLRVVPADHHGSANVWMDDDVPMFPVFALAEYDGVVRKAVVRWKNTVDRELTQTMARIFAEACEDVEYCVGAPGKGGSLPWKGDVAVVPAPSRFRRKHDGRFVAGVLAEAAAGALCDRGVDAHGMDVLRTGSLYGSGKLESRNAKARQIHMKKHASVTGMEILLVDDVLTTGATLAGAAEALAAQGAVVRAALVVAVAPDPRNVVRRRTAPESLRP